MKPAGSIKYEIWQRLFKSQRDTDGEAEKRAHSHADWVATPTVWKVGLFRKVSGEAGLHLTALVRLLV